jgi:Leucine-rich repeat (LRR) protein
MTTFSNPVSCRQESCSSLVAVVTKLLPFLLATAGVALSLTAAVELDRRVPDKSHLHVPKLLPTAAQGQETNSAQYDAKSMRPMDIGASKLPMQIGVNFKRKVKSEHFAWEDIRTPDLPQDLANSLRKDIEKSSIVYHEGSKNSRTYPTTAEVTYGTIQSSLCDLVNVSIPEMEYLSTSPWNCSVTATDYEVCTAWHGITCGNVSNYYFYVTGIKIDGVGASGGSLPDSLSTFSYLQQLIMPDNALKGSIPSSLGGLPYLYYIDLGSNQLTNSIPSSLSELSYLAYFDVGSNKLSGPLFPTSTAYYYLMYLDVSSNSMTGTVPSLLAYSAYLKYLSVKSNLFTGTIPTVLGTLSYMKYFDVGYNYFYSSIDDLDGVISSMSSLQYLDFGFNPYLTKGSIPSSLQNLTDLQYLGIYETSLTGTLPTFLGDLTDLNYLCIFFTSLTGTIPSEIGKLTNLYYLWLQYNSLSGTVPSSLGNIMYLNNFILYYNSLTGPVPSSLGNIPYIQTLILGYNSLNGTIPSSLSKLYYLEYLHLDFNQLTGTIPQGVSKLVNMDSLILCGNALTGTMPTYMGSLVDLQYLYLGNCVNSYVEHDGNNFLTGKTLTNDIRRLVVIRSISP